MINLPSLLGLYGWVSHGVSHQVSHRVSHDKPQDQSRRHRGPAPAGPAVTTASRCGAAAPTSAAPAPPPSAQHVVDRTWPSNNAEGFRLPRTQGRRAWASNSPCTSSKPPLNQSLGKPVADWRGGALVSRAWGKADSVRVSLARPEFDLSEHAVQHKRGDDDCEGPPVTEATPTIHGISAGKHDGPTRDDQNRFRTSSHNGRSYASAMIPQIASKRCFTHGVKLLTLLLPERSLITSNQVAWRTISRAPAIMATTATTFNMRPNLQVGV